MRDKLNFQIQKLYRGIDCVHCVPRSLFPHMHKSLWTRLADYNLARDIIIYKDTYIVQYKSNTRAHTHTACEAHCNHPHTYKPLTRHNSPTNSCKRKMTGKTSRNSIGPKERRIISAEGDSCSCSSYRSHVIAHTYAACTLTVYIGNFLMGVILVSRR